MYLKCSFYESAGVSIRRGNFAVQKMKTCVEKTYNKNVLSKHGCFGGMYRLGDHTLVSSIDGVGTKTKFVTNVLQEHGYINLGKDLVNHLTNDILVQGAYPLFFLDYYGTNYLKIEEVINYIKGISDACIENDNIPIMGGETAEMPLIYKENSTDLVGCMLGLIDPKWPMFVQVKPGDVLVGLPSVGPHTNGYSLINKITKEHGLPNDEDVLNAFIEPHKSYLNEVKEFANIFGHDQVKAMCHITGGGIVDNLKRVIPNSLEIHLDDNMVFPKWCEYIMDTQKIAYEEMSKVYNCGVGFVIVVSPNVFEKLHQVSFPYMKIGHVMKNTNIVVKSRSILV